VEVNAFSTVEVTTVRHGYWHGGGWLWPVLSSVLWIALLAVIVWAVVLFVRRWDARGRVHRETPQEILDRRYASGEIDAAAYTEARELLAGRFGGPPNATPPAAPPPG
jgi:putative membrane protein